MTVAHSTNGTADRSVRNDDCMDQGYAGGRGVVSSITMYDRILVPTDGSTAGEHALEHAIDLARTHEATIQVLYVVTVSGYGGIPIETAWEGVSDALYAEGHDAVERAESIVPADVDVETHVLEGSPSRTIVDQATPDSCDLIVMGTHGRNGIDRLLLGSVTERVVRRADIPVLAVRIGEDDRDGRDEPRAQSPVAVD